MSTDLALLQHAETLIRAHVETEKVLREGDPFYVSTLMPDGSVIGEQGQFERHWSPDVALTVADVIHQAAMDVWAHGPLCICTTGCDACDDNLWEPHARNALTLARTYIGETA